MSPAFAYVYVMSPEPEKIRALAPAHVAYWRGLALTDYRGGPFEDRGGGLITFRAGSVEEAENAVAADPFVTGSVVGDRWLKQWAVD